MENGKIPVSKFIGLAKSLTDVSSGVLRLLLEGYSHKRGKQPEWLTKSVDFQLSGLKEGSTVLEMEAPLLKEVIQQPQLPIPFDDLDFRELMRESAIDLSMRAFHQAFSQTEGASLLDKALLKDMQKLKKVLDSDEATVTITGKTETPISLQKSSFREIKQLESSTPESMTVRLTGTLNAMRYSDSLLQIITQGKTIRAFLSEQMAMNEAKSYFGEEVTVDGWAHFNPKGQVTSVEVSHIRLAEPSDGYFKRIPSPIQQQMMVKDVAREQNYKGTSIDRILGKWPGDESIDDLIEMID